MPLTPATFDEKLQQMDHEKIRRSAEIFNNLLEDTDLVPYGTPQRSFLETLASESSFLEAGDYTDFGKELALNNLNGLKGDLDKVDKETKEPVRKALKDLFMKQKVYSQQECYDALQTVDDFFEIGLNAKEIRYGAEAAAKMEEAEQKEAEKKRIAKEKRVEAERVAEERKPTWLKYVLRHKPEEGKAYKSKEKKTLLSKMMVAANIHAANLDKPEGEKTPFDLSAARNLSAKLMDKWAFKHITRDPNRLEALLEKEPADLAAETQDIRRPFARMSVEDRKNKIRELQGMLKYMDPKEGRSTKYKNMYESIEGITEEQLNGLQECDDPKKNGEDLLQNIFDNTEKYQKGKKSLRSKADQACRFDQSVDVLACLGNSTRAAQDMTEGLIDRINDVRESHGQPRYSSVFYGSKEHFREHSNATRRFHAQKKEFQLRQQQGIQGLKEPKDPFAEPPKPRNILPFNENATLLDHEKYAESPESLNLFTGDSGDFVEQPREMHKSTWRAYRETEMSKEQTAQLLAGVFAAKETPLLYSKAWKRVGCDETVFKAKYNEYLNDPSIGKMAEKLKDPDARKEYFPEGQEVSFETLDVNKLSQEYQELAGPAPEL